MRAALTRAWDGVVSPWPLAIFRVGIASLVLVRTNDLLRPFVSLDHHAWLRGFEYLPGEESVLQPALHSPLFPMPPWPDAVATVLVHARTMLALLLLVGLRPRLAAGLLALVGYGLMAADRFRYMHHLHLLWISCAWLAFAPSGERLSIERWLRPAPQADVVPVWSLRLLRLQCVVAYGAAAVAKLGADWLDGSTLARYRETHLVHGALVDASARLLGTSGLAVAIAAIEIALVPLLLSRRTRLFGVALGLAFHAALHASMMLSTFTATMALYLVTFLPWPERLTDAAAAT